MWSGRTHQQSTPGLTSADLPVRLRPPEAWANPWLISEGQLVIKGLWAVETYLCFIPKGWNEMEWNVKDFRFWRHFNVLYWTLVDALSWNDKPWRHRILGMKKSEKKSRWWRHEVFSLWSLVYISFWTGWAGKKSHVVKTLQSLRSYDCSCVLGFGWYALKTSHCHFYRFKDSQSVTGSEVVATYSLLGTSETVFSRKDKMWGHSFFHYVQNVCTYCSVR